MRYGREVAAYDYIDENGALLFQVVRFERDSGGTRKKTFRQRRADPAKKGGWNYRVTGVRRVLFRLPDVIRAVAEDRTVFVAEGEKCVERLVREGFVATCNSGGAKKWGPDHTAILHGAKVAILPDNDAVGREHAELVARSLHGIAAEVRVLSLPGLADRGSDVVDWFDSGRSRADLERVADEAPLWSPSATLPAIDVTVDEVAVIDHAVVALAKHPGVFRRGPLLVRILRDVGHPIGALNPPAPPRIALMPLPRLRELLAGSAEWWSTERTRSGDLERVRVHPPEWVVREVDARGEWPQIRPLKAVVDVPVLRPDGTILDTPGYDAATGIVYEPAGESVRLPAAPSEQDAIAARDAILDVVADFPFATDVDRAASVASLLTPLARFAFSGPAPLFLLEANVRAAGKSRLCDVVALIVSGRQMARAVCPDNEDEMRKRITTLAISGDRLVLLDNLAGTFGHASLDCALTASVWKDRVLGRNEDTGALPLIATWFASGNNVRLRGDLTRRVARIRLESPLENPERRSDFRHPDLLLWVASERPRLLSAALTILRAYFVAGRPKADLPPWGSFEGWSGIVRQSVVWVGLADPGEAREDLEEDADTDKVALREVIAGWQELDPNGRGETVRGALKRLKTRPATSTGSELCWKRSVPYVGRDPTLG